MHGVCNVLVSGKDGKSRVARIKIGTSSMLHPNQRLVPLEVSPHLLDDVAHDDVSEVVDVVVDEEPAVMSHRPQCQIRHLVRLDL